MKNDVKSLKSFIWIITRKCNYDCHYCSICKTRAYERELPLAEKFPGYLKNRLNGKWEITITGGEPFVVPGFLKIAKELVAQGHQITVVTNFSAPLAQIKEFIDVAGGRLGLFRASLHLDHIKLNDFLQRSLIIKNLINNKFRVELVASKKYVYKLSEIIDFFQSHNIMIHIYKERARERKLQYVKYTAEELAIITSCTQKVFREKRPNTSHRCYRGVSCKAGINHFILDETGDAWRCMPATRLSSSMKKNNDFLGNITDGTFSLHKQPTPCRYDKCYCVDPIRYRLIEIPQHDPVKID